MAIVLDTPSAGVTGASETQLADVLADAIDMVEPAVGYLTGCSIRLDPLCPGKVMLDLQNGQAFDVLIVRRHSVS